MRTVNHIVEITSNNRKKKLVKKEKADVKKIQTVD